MSISRRHLLKSLLAAPVIASLGGCEKVISFLAKEGQSIPKKLTLANTSQIDPVFHLLSRAAYGPWPGDIERVRKMGVDNWLEEQLEPQKINDELCDLRARRFETLHHHPGNCFEYKRRVLRNELIRHTLLRATYSKRQLFEVMVGFWSDHINIDIGKGDCIYLKTTDDREVIRKHALGNFRDLIRASATSPAMLVYLDGKNNKKKDPKDIPNENYARELLELHTLGVHGGYTQQDVSEVARCLTGWRVRRKSKIFKGSLKGTSFFSKWLHDDGEKKVLGHTIAAGGGVKDLEQVVDIVCNHESTAHYIATKLVRRFVSDNPPKSLIEKVAKEFKDTKGDIKSLMRAIFKSEEFTQSAEQKFKRPFRYIVSALRLLGTDTHARRGLTNYLGQMGQALFQYPTPDGYPDEGEIWMATLLWRWNFAFAVARNKVPSVRSPLNKLARSLGISDNDEISPGDIFPYFVGRVPTEKELEALQLYVLEQNMKDKDYKAELLGLILCSPAFQRY